MDACFRDRIDAGRQLAAKLNTYAGRDDVIDLGLPRKDGYQVAREVRAALGREVRLIALTGYGQPEDKLRAEQMGFDAFLTKPVELEDILRALALP